MKKNIILCTSVSACLLLIYPMEFNRAGLLLYSSCHLLHCCDNIDSLLLYLYTLGFPDNVSSFSFTNDVADSSMEVAVVDVEIDTIVNTFTKNK